MKTINKLLPLLFATASLSQAKLTAWYPLDEPPAAAATVAENISANNPTLVGFDPDPALSFIERGHPSASSALGTSYLLTKGGALLLGANAAVQPTDQFTISFFYQPATFDAFDRIFESLDGNDNTQHGIRIDTGTAGNRVRVLVRSNAAANTNFTHPLTLKNDGTWYFCAFRYDTTIGDATGFKLTVLELNGTPIDEAAITAATNSPGALNTGAMSSPHALETVIGSSNTAATGGNTLNAALDEFAFYDNSDGNGVLSDTQLANAANFGPSLTELVTSFTTDTQSVSPGNSATLSWIINEPFDSLTLDDGAGNITDLAPLTTTGTGSTMVTPSSPTTYYLKGVNGEVENVHVVKLIAGTAPEISSFTSSASIVGLGDSVDLSWTVIGADSLSLDPGAIDVSALSTISQTVSQLTTFTLSATNGFGTTTASVTVDATDGPIPAHSYLASAGSNSASTWIDLLDAKNVSLTNLTHDLPLTNPSANSTISGSYLSAGGATGGAVGAFQFPDSTFEIWLRPAALAADHQVIFETGGGFNGVSALINQNGLRFLGSSADVRTLDLVVPLSGINLTDFIQVVFSTSASADTFEVSVRDTFGATTSASESADIILGGNGATLFNWGAGGIGGNETGLGGRTEIDGTSPAGLSSFTGEIAIVNVYSSILDTTEIDQAFVQVAPNVTPQTGGVNAITNISYDGANEVSLTWNSVPGTNYDAEFSTDLITWVPFGTSTQASDIETTNPFAVPPNQPRFFFRIIETTP